MKKHLTLFLLATLSTQSFALENCSEDSLSPSLQAEELAEQNCDVVDKMRSCAEIQPDPEAMKRKITNLLDRAESGDFKKNWAHWKTVPAVTQVHVQTSSDKDKYPTPIVDWLSDPAFLGSGINKEEVKNSIINKYVEYSKNYDCVPEIKYRNTGLVYPNKLTAKSDVELAKMTKDPTLAAERAEFFKKKNANAIGELNVCNPNYYNPGPWKKVGYTVPPCTGNVSGLFKDNISNISTLDQKILNSETNDLSACIQKALAEGAKIHHVSVVSSASALNNTGEAAKKYCKKGFLALSEARANSARDKILPEIFSKAGQSNYDYTSKLAMDFRGSNGDGTSGACPYTLVDGKEVLKEKYRTPAGKKELDSNKYVSVHVTFEEQFKTVEDKKAVYEPHYPCKEIYFQCAPK